METVMLPGYRRKRNKPTRWMALGALFVAAALAVLLWSHISSNSSRATPVYMNVKHPIMLKGEWSGKHAIGEGEGLKIPLSVAQDLLGEEIRYEEKTETIVLTTNSKVLHLQTGKLGATLNRKPFKMSFTAEKNEGELYLPLAPLKQLFGMEAEVGEGTGIVTLVVPGTPIQRAAVPEAARKDVQLREGPGKSFAIVESLTPKANVRRWGESDGWYKAQSETGQIGFVSKRSVSLANIELPAGTPEADEPFDSWQGKGKRINLTWEAVYTANPNVNAIGKLQGVNVVSPTWFELSNGQGDIRSNADAGYSAWAKSKGIQVWGLFSNGFEPDRTHVALASYESRLAMIQQLLAYAKSFGLNGINLDFENIYTKDKENLVQFVRELTPLLHEQNLVVSIDVTPKSSSEMWSLFLDRERLGNIVDYMMIMAYDEHWASSPTSGSVSSLPWAEQSIERILQEDGVPAEKLILGIPFYTRIWSEKPDGNGGVDVSSKTMDMDAAIAVVKEKKLTPVVDAETGQHYVEYKDGSVRKRIWLEDTTSVKARAELVKKYRLAGIASWRRGFESSDVWPALDDTLQSRP
jgi:spore germination protein YaaH